MRRNAKVHKNWTEGFQDYTVASKDNRNMIWRKIETKLYDQSLTGISLKG